MEAQTEVQGIRNILSIESAIGSGSICVAVGHSTVAVSNHSGGASRAEDLLAVVDGVLEESGVSKSNLDSVAVSIGPGSFTGLRIGISTAMGLAAGLGIPCIRVPLLPAIALHQGKGRDMIIAVPMGRSDVCFQRFSDGYALGEPHAGKLCDLRSSVESIPIASLAFHRLLAGGIRECEDLANMKQIDLGTNMAEYISVAAFNSLINVDGGPIYVQNPRFR